jgi:hypothetical protein
MRADVMNALRGGSPASKAAALSNYASQNAQSNAGLFNQALQSQAGNLAQAGSLEGAASQGLDASKQSNYATEVVPFLNAQGDYVGSENAATAAGAQAAQSFTETQKQNKMNTKDSFTTIKSLLGGMGQGAAETGLFGALFNEDKLTEDAKNKKGIEGLIGTGSPNIPTVTPVTNQYASFDIGKELFNSAGRTPNLPTVPNANNMFGVNQNGILNQNMTGSSQLPPSMAKGMAAINSINATPTGPSFTQQAQNPGINNMPNAGIMGLVGGMFGPNQNLQLQQNMTGNGMTNNLPLPTSAGSAIQQLLGLIQGQIQLPTP